MFITLPYDALHYLAGRFGVTAGGWGGDRFGGGGLYVNPLFSGISLFSFSLLKNQLNIVCLP